MELPCTVINKQIEYGIIYYKALNRDFKPLYDLKCLFYQISDTSTIWDTVLGSELSIRIFRVQNRVIMPMIGVISRTSCRQLFKELNILTLAK